MNLKKVLLTSICICALGGGLVSACSSSSSPANGVADAQADVTTDDGSPFDANQGVTDSGDGMDSSDGSACYPIDPVGYTHTWIPPLVSRGKCTDAQLDAFAFTDFFGPMATAATRMAFKQNNPDCAACLVTDTTASGLGALLHSPTIGLYNPNISGCLALLSGDSSVTSCAAQTQKDIFCELAACDGCRVSVGHPVTAYSVCNAASVQLPTCAPLNEAGASCYAASPDHATCSAASYPTSGDFYRFLGNMFCGPPDEAGDAAGGG